VQPQFDPQLAFIPWKDRLGYYMFVDHGNELRSGPLRQINFNIYVPQFTTFAGQTQERGGEVFVGLTSRSDIRLNLSKSRVNYPDGLDDVQGVGLTFNSSNRFKRFGGFYQTGTRAGQKTTYQSLHGSYRLLKRLDIGFNLSELRYRGVDRLGIFTLGYEISPTQAITGRMVTRNGGVNAYLAYRNGGGRGTEYYLILGDPNANRTQTRVSVKVVWAF
jgi:hypothetical protein